MGLLEKAFNAGFNAAFGTPSSANKFNPGLGNQFSGQGPLNQPRHYSTSFDKPATKPVATGPKKLDLHGGTYKDPSRFDNNFRYRVQEDLKGTLRDHSTRAAVAGIFYESRGGSGISKGEIKDGLNRLVRQGKINEDQMWAVRKKYGVF